MRIPTLQGVIDRRILVNYRVEPDCLSRLLPSPFRPLLVNGHGMAGICLIRLKQIRPIWMPSVFGLQSENAAHRIAVEWDEEGAVRSGVYIPRRDTSSRINAWAGGRVFPGEHHVANFQVAECGNDYRVSIQSEDNSTRVLVAGSLSDGLPDGSVFESIEAASKFFETGSISCSPNCRSGSLDAMELKTFNWQVQPLAANQIESSFFDDPKLFPVGTVTFDHALLMREIQHQWIQQANLQP